MLLVEKYFHIYMGKMHLNLILCAIVCFTVSFWFFGSMFKVVFVFQLFQFVNTHVSVILYTVCILSFVLCFREEGWGIYAFIY